MKKAGRVLFLLLMLITCFQLTGAEEAFCEESSFESDCRDCFMCPTNQFTGMTSTASLPAIVLSGYTFLNYSFHQIEFPPTNIFRPPITF